ncbi:MAG TPA: TIR domain-containing protein [Thermoanaerobaculia bacterium]|nr:TIR domain-containing protein [Thermoanaerobaculia bacterium]
MTKNPSTLRLYLTALPGDMEGERAVIEGLVLPELRERLRGRGVEIVIVDPSRAKGEKWDLERRFQEIEECQIFVALVGERYGAPPDMVPFSLVTAQPWLLDDPGRSVFELEILQGALRRPEGSASFFYFRNPRFPWMVPEEKRPRFLPEDDAAAVRLADLKDRIRASGRPVFDGYPCGWSEGLDRASQLDSFAEMMFGDLWKAIQELTGRPPEREPMPVEVAAESDETISVPAPPVAKPPEDKALPLHENVQFTVYRPRIVEPMKWVPLLAFAHLEELPADAPPDEPDPLEEVKAQAHRLLGDLAGRYADVKQDSRQAVPHEAEITFVPEIPGFGVNPPRRTFLWLESVHREEFRICPGPAMEGKQARGRLSVFWGSILLAEVSLAFRVTSRAAAAPSAPSEPAASRPFRNIFPSYSHKDAVIVEEFERYARTLGDRYLRDVHELRAGEVWNDRLKELIQKADVFQLFWSWNALRSRYVEEEWRYALTLGRSHFVRPTYWEDPLPEEPSRSLPPEELRRLHFQLLPGGASSQRSPQPRKEVSPPRPAATPAITRGGTRGLDPNETVVAFPGAHDPLEEDRGVLQSIDWGIEDQEGSPLDDSTLTAVVPKRDSLDETRSTPWIHWEAPTIRPPEIVVPTLPPPPPIRMDLPAEPPSVSGARLSTSSPEPTASSYSPAPMTFPASRHRGTGRWLGIAATVAAAVIGLSIFALIRKAPNRPISMDPGSTTHEPRTTATPAALPIINPETWERLASACRLDAANARKMPTRFAAGSPIVQIASSEDATVAARTLARHRNQGAFLLPLEEGGRAVCTVNLGPYPSRAEAERAAAELRVADGVDAKVVGYPQFTRELAPPVAR